MYVVLFLLRYERTVLFRRFENHVFAGCSDALILSILHAISLSENRILNTETHAKPLYRMNRIYVFHFIIYTFLQLPVGIERPGVDVNHNNIYHSQLADQETNDCFEDSIDLVAAFFFSHQTDHSFD